MSAAERVAALRGLADASNRCMIRLTDEEHEALEDAIALYDCSTAHDGGPSGRLCAPLGDEGEVTT